jgi:hypothetical protein
VMVMALSVSNWISSELAPAAFSDPSMMAAKRRRDGFSGPLWRGSLRLS